MDTQKRASLLREILEERVFDDKAWEALYDRLAKRYGCPYVPGSLCQLQMIERYIKGNKPISVPEQPIKVPEKPISVHILIDGWPALPLDEKTALPEGAIRGQSLEGDLFLIEKGDYMLPMHSRNVRSVPSWIKCQFALIRGCLTP